MKILICLMSISILHVIYYVLYPVMQEHLATVGVRSGMDSERQPI